MTGWVGGQPVLLPVSTGIQLGQAHLVSHPRPWGAGCIAVTAQWPFPSHPPHLHRAAPAQLGVLADPLIPTVLRSTNSNQHLGFIGTTAVGVVGGLSKPSIRSTPGFVSPLNSSTIHCTGPRCPCCGLSGHCSKAGAFWPGDTPEPVKV